MVDSGLHTTNLFLGIMAVVSLLEGLLVLGLGVGAFIAYRRVMALVNDLEAKHVAPAVARVTAILDDLKVVSSRVTEQTERVDHAIKSTIDRVDDTADRVKYNVRTRASQIVGVVRGIRTAIETFMSNGSHRPRADAPGQA
jgi:hypothetical protein